MSPGPNDFAVDTRRNSEERGGQALLGSLQYTEQQHRPSPPPRRDTLKLRQSHHEPEEGPKQYSGSTERSRILWLFVVVLS